MSIPGLGPMHAALLLRLGAYSPIYIAAPERMTAARELERAGLCRCAFGDCPDAGLLLAFRGAGWTRRGEHDWTPPNRTPVLRPLGGGGGAA